MLATLHTGLNLKIKKKKGEKKAGGKDAQEQLSQMPFLCSAMRIMEWIYLTYLVSQHIWQLWTQHSSAAFFFFFFLQYFKYFHIVRFYITEQKYHLLTNTTLHTIPELLFFLLLFVQHQCPFIYTNWDDIWPDTFSNRKKQKLFFITNMFDYESVAHAQHLIFLSRPTIVMQWKQQQQHTNMLTFRFLSRVQHVIYDPEWFPLYTSIRPFLFMYLLVKREKSENHSIQPNVHHLLLPAVSPKYCLTSFYNRCVFKCLVCLLLLDKNFVSDVEFRGLPSFAFLHNTLNVFNKNWPCEPHIIWLLIKMHGCGWRGPLSGLFPCLTIRQKVHNDSCKHNCN